jgi:hypothetical protein
VTPDVPHRDAPLFRLLVDDLHQLLAAFLSELRDCQPDYVAVVNRVQAKVDFWIAFDGAERLPVPGWIAMSQKPGRSPLPIVERKHGIVMSTQRFDELPRPAVLSRRAPSGRRSVLHPPFR